MDIVDKAKQLEQHQRGVAISAVRDKVNQVGTTECIDCDETIPEARREAYPAAKRCIECQTKHEEKR